MTSIQGLLWAFASLKGLRSLSQDPILFQYPDDYGWKLMKPAFIPPSDYSINYHPNMGRLIEVIEVVTYNLCNRS